jgi:ADP-ribose pyrophosphatase YjhB (NUDIX family)
MKAVPGGARHTPAPQSGGWGSINQVAANAQWGNPYSQSGYGPFLPRPSTVFTDGAFGPMSPIQPVPVDQPPPGGEFPDPRYWQAPVGWNLPTQPGSEGLKLASFQQLYTLSTKYSVAQQCIRLRKDEIRGLEWSIELSTEAAKAYQGDHKAMRDFGERKAEATKFFRHPDPDFWSFGSFMDALLEEIFVYDALSLIFRPKYGKGLGRGLLGSDLDSMRLVSGPTIRPLLDMHGGKPRPPAPSYQQFLYGVPRSDYQTIITGSDIDDYGLTGAQVNEFRADVMLYAPLVCRRETPYGFPPIERALLPIISGLQKQEYQLSYFTEGTIPSVYISPGDPNMTPTQVKELQDALNGIAGDPSYHMKVIVLPPGSKVEPQRPVDLSDTFDTLVQTQVAMAFDVMPDELGLLPNVGSPGAGGGSNASAVRFAAQGSRDPKARKSTKPLLLFLADIFNYVLQDICGQADMRFQFEGLVDDEDKQEITSLGVEQVQNGISSIDEVRERLDMPPWGLTETSEPVVFTAQGPIPFSMAPQLIANMQGGGAGGQGTNGGQRTTSSRTRNSQPTVRQGGQTKPNGSHPAPVSPHRESVTPAHSAAAGAIQSPTPRTGGTTSRSSVAGSRKKAVDSELGALARHLRKGRLISTWDARHIPARALGMIAEDLAKGVLIDTACERAGDICLADDDGAANASAKGTLLSDVGDDEPTAGTTLVKAAHWPGWERDLGLVGRYKSLIGQAFHDAETRGSALRKKAATGGMFVSNGVLRDLIGDEVREVFSGVLTPLWTHAWNLGYESAKSLVTGQRADFTAKHEGDHLAGFIGTEGEHWLSSIARTGLGNNSARSELIARTEVARAVNSAAIQCYRDLGVTHKHLLLAPDACDICVDAAEDGDIPLDAPFSSGGVLGLSHPGDRCVPAPSGVWAEPPLAGLGKAAAAEDESRLAWLLLRARDEDGKWRFLLQQRPDGSWGMPGGKPHIGEDPWGAAVRETTEEIGTLPPLGTWRIAGTFHHVEDDGETQVYLWLCDVPYFHPSLDGSTPEETRGAAWFRRKERIREPGL